MDSSYRDSPQQDSRRSSVKSAGLHSSLTRGTSDEDSASESAIYERPLQGWQDIEQNTNWPEPNTTLMNTDERWQDFVGGAQEQNVNAQARAIVRSRQFLRLFMTHFRLDDILGGPPNLAYTCSCEQCTNYQRRVRSQSPFADRVFLRAFSGIANEEL